MGFFWDAEDMVPGSMFALREREVVSWMFWTGRDSNGLPSFARTDFLAAR